MRSMKMNKSFVMRFVFTAMLIVPVAAMGCNSTDGDGGSGGGQSGGNQGGGYQSAPAPSAPEAPHGGGMDDDIPF